MALGSYLTPRKVSFHKTVEAASIEVSGFSAVLPSGGSRVSGWVRGVYGGAGDGAGGAGGRLGSPAPRRDVATTTALTLPSTRVPPASLRHLVYLALLAFASLGYIYSKFTIGTVVAAVDCAQVCVNNSKNYQDVGPVPSALVHVNLWYLSLLS